MEQLILHLFGDYITQSDWMAQNKTKANLPAFLHALIYSFPFLLLTGRAPNPALAGTTILVTHFLIDRYRLARYVVWAKNWMGANRLWKNGHDVTMLFTDGDGEVYRQPTPHLSECPVGYPPDQPAWLSVWLLIVADNALHLAINYAALRWL